MKRKSRARRLATAKQNVGIVREIGDGVAKIEGLTDTMLNEMLDFGNGITGIALNLEETEVGAIILGDYTEIKEGDEVRTTGKLLQVPVGKGLLGRVVNALGQPLDGKGADQGKRHFIRWKKSRPASSNANPSASRCRPASWRLTR